MELLNIISVKIFTRIVQRPMIIKIFKYSKYGTNNLREIN